MGSCAQKSPRPDHLFGADHRVELGVGDVAAADGLLAQGRAVLVSGLGDLGGRVVADLRRQRGDQYQRAVDALPLLQAAESVRIVAIKPPEGSGDPDGVSTADIAAALTRHGVKCEAVTALGSNSAVGGSLLSGMAEHGSDLLVMGAYGHSRLREFVFGGATQHVLKHMTAPVLMSH